MNEIILFAHPTFGVLGVLATVWVFVEALNARESNAARTRTAAIVAAICITLAGLFAGYWYVRFYGPDKAIILSGPWPLAHHVVMEIKEHAFFIMLILAVYLSIAVRDQLDSNVVARRMVLFVAALVVFIGLALEGAGAVVSFALKLGLQAGGPPTGGE